MRAVERRWNATQDATQWEDKSEECELPESKLRFRDAGFFRRGCSWISP